MLIWMAQGTAAVAVLMFILWLLHFPLRMRPSSTWDG